MEIKITTSMKITPKEEEIIQLVKVGMTDKEIADQLGKSIQTVRNQLRTLYLRWGARNRAHAVSILIRTQSD